MNFHDFFHQESYLLNPNTQLYLQKLQKNNQRHSNEAKSFFFFPYRTWYLKQSPHFTFMESMLKKSSLNPEYLSLFNLYFKRFPSLLHSYLFRKLRCNILLNLFIAGCLSNKNILTSLYNQNLTFVQALNHGQWAIPLRTRPYDCYQIKNHQHAFLKYFC